LGLATVVVIPDQQLLGGLSTAKITHCIPRGAI
jgi:hypothetical protein